MKYILDVDASKVIEAVRSTGVTITPAMRHYAHYLISNMKNIGTWQLSNAIYGFVGGTAASHKWNWKDLRDVDAAFRLTFVGGVTHSANGMQGNGVDGYADTKLNADVVLNLNSTHVSFYSRTNVNRNAIDIGVYQQSNNSAISIQSRKSDNTSAFDINQSSFTLVSSTNSLGYFIANRSASNIKNGWARGVKVEAVGTVSSFKPNGNIFILALNSVAFSSASAFSNRQAAFSTIGAGLTDTQAIAQSQIVTNAQAILNRL